MYNETPELRLSDAPDSNLGVLPDPVLPAGLPPPVNMEGPHTTPVVSEPVVTTRAVDADRAAASDDVKPNVDALNDEPIVSVNIQAQPDNNLGDATIAITTTTRTTDDTLHTTTDAPTGVHQPARHK